MAHFWVRSARYKVGPGSIIGHAGARLGEYWLMVSRQRGTAKLTGLNNYRDYLVVEGQVLRPYDLNCGLHTCTIQFVFTTQQYIKFTTH
jgi:hypothetical protein